MSSDRIASVVTDDDGTVRVRCDAPGERAVSAPVGDVFGFITQLAEAAGFLVEHDTPDELVVTVPE